MAERLGINRVGILGILVSAKHRGLVPVIKPVIDDLMTNVGFWISDDLYNHILRVVGET